MNLEKVVFRLVNQGEILEVSHYVNGVIYYSLNDQIINQWSDQTI